MISALSSGRAAEFGPLAISLRPPVLGLLHGVPLHK